MHLQSGYIPNQHRIRQNISTITTLHSPTEYKAEEMNSTVTSVANILDGMYSLYRYMLIECGFNTIECTHTIFVSYKISTIMLAQHRMQTL